MSSVNSLLPSGGALLREAAGGPPIPADALRDLLGALTRETTAAAAATLLRNWVGAVQAELLWTPLAADAMTSGSEPALARLAQAAVARDDVISEPDAPGNTLPVWIGVGAPLRCDTRTIGALGCRIAADR